MLASHHHGDHFDAEAVARHLASNPGARFVSTRQAVDRLQRLKDAAEKAKIELSTTQSTQINLPFVTAHL